MDCLSALGGHPRVTGSHSSDRPRRSGDRAVNAPKTLDERSVNGARLGVQTGTNRRLRPGGLRRDVTPSLRSVDRLTRVPDTRHFAGELDFLRQRLLVMGELAEERVRTAIGALVAGDRDEVRRVIDGDRAIDALQIEIDDRCFRLLALQQPVAVDLRFVVTVTKITVDLERVGDLAVNIAEAADRYLEHPVKVLVDLPRMCEIAQHILATVLGAFLAQDPALAKKVLADDDRLDQVRDGLFRELLAHMHGNPNNVESAVDLILMSRHLERIGAHATNIAEDIIFITEARDVRHSRRLQ